MKLPALIALLCLVGFNASAHADSLTLDGALAASAGWNLGEVAPNAPAGVNKAVADKVWNPEFGTLFGDLSATRDFGNHVRMDTAVHMTATRGGVKVHMDAFPTVASLTVSPTSAVGITAGLQVTHLGYFNRDRWASSWLTNAVQRPTILDRDRQVVPTNMVGVSVHGSVPLGGGQFQYAIGVGNARSTEAGGELITSDVNVRPTFTGLADLTVGRKNTLRVIASGWTTDLEGFSMSALDTTQMAGAVDGLALREYGANLAVAFDTAWVAVVAEYVHVRHDDASGTVAASELTTRGGIAEVAFKLGSVSPYVRVDISELPDAGMPVAEAPGKDVGSDDAATSYRGGVAGFSWSVTRLHRFAIEYGHRLDGAATKHSVSAEIRIAM